MIAVVVEIGGVGVEESPEEMAALLYAERLGPGFQVFVRVYSTMYRRGLQEYQIYGPRFLAQIELKSRVFQADLNMILAVI